MRIALFQPDIAQNTGTILRLCACLGLGADIIEPTGFAWSDAKFRRSGMDYLDAVEMTRHSSWDAFIAWRQRETPSSRLVLLTTKASTSYVAHHYRADDILLLGRESAGVPDEIHASADARLRIPIRAGMRSLNIAMAAAMVAGEAVRQIGSAHL
jgi:tRNA (cytidine/uridine-2'-O-)-methyltransferase